MRRLFSFICTLCLVVAILAVAGWIYSYRLTSVATDRYALTDKLLIGTSRGVVIYSNDKQTIGEGGATVATSATPEWYWQSFYEKGLSSDKGTLGFAHHAEIGKTGQVIWRFIAVPYWAIIVVLLILPALALMGAGRKKSPAAAEPTDAAAA